MTSLCVQLCDCSKGPAYFALDLLFLNFEIKSLVNIQLREAIPREKCSFLNIVQKAFDPPLSFEHHVVNFSEGILTKVRKRLSQQLSTK